jgi:hypothetical protein
LVTEGQAMAVAQTQAGGDSGQAVRFIGVGTHSLDVEVLAGTAASHRQ